MLLVIDNYDSFTYNLVQLFGQLGEEVVVHRNDQITIDTIRNLAPDRIVISPGPGTPLDAGISIDVMREFAAELPILGVCLGHQCMAHLYGGTWQRADRLMHGKTSLVHHDGQGVYRGMPNPFTATRYHSLIVPEETLPEELVPTARTAEGELMGIRHRTLPLEGVQFHPESFLTQDGPTLLANFLSMTGPRTEPKGATSP